MKKIERVTRICLNCEGKFDVLDSSNTKFCNIGCYWEQLKGKKSNRTGYIVTKNVRSKISKKVKDHWKNGVYKNKKSIKGIKPWNYGMGIGVVLGKQIRNNPRYIEWRNTIFKRDKYECIWGGIEHGKKLHVDHIKPLMFILEEHQIKSLFDALNCNEIWDISNGRTLCIDCHKTTDTYAGRVQSLFYKIYGNKRIF